MMAPPGFSTGCQTACLLVTLCATFAVACTGGDIAVRPDDAGQPDAGPGTIPPLDAGVPSGDAATPSDGATTPGHDAAPPRDGAPPPDDAAPPLDASPPADGPEGPLDGGGPDGPIVNPFLGPGPRSGYPHFWTGGWISATDKAAAFAADRGMDFDAVTSSLRPGSEWYQLAGFDSQAAFDSAFDATPGQFDPPNQGAFSGDYGTNLRPNLWEGSKAELYRQALYHIGLTSHVPGSRGNADCSNPGLWYEMAVNGVGDEYYFMLGRQFAARDAQHPRPQPTTIDWGYEWSFNSDPHTPCDLRPNPPNGPGWQWWRNAWSRGVKAFKLGYEYQSGAGCPCRFSWRPHQKYEIVDARPGQNNRKVHFTEIFPNDVASATVAARTYRGRQVMVAGPLGRQVDFVGLSLHDNTPDPPGVVSGDTRSQSNNWDAVLDGSDRFWGLRQVFAFARQKQVLVVLPEWAPYRGTSHPVSEYPGGYIRLMHETIMAGRDVFAYETFFCQGDGTIDGWPTLPAGRDDPKPVYLDLWRR
jgi:hypothetical protein